MLMHYSKIVVFEGSWDSGMAQLHIEDLSGKTKAVRCDNGPTVRMLNRLFPGIITSGQR